MSILSDLFLQQQAISQNPVKELGMSQINAKTPQQIAYDNMLQAQKQSAKREIIDNTLAGLGTGLNGVGKIIANSTVNNPWQQEAVANSLNANDDRLQQQMRDYAQRQADSRRNFVDEAEEQLALARQDEDKQYAREQDEAKFAYQKAMDELKQKNLERQIKNQETLQDAQIDKLKADTEAAGYTTEAKKQAEEQEKIKLVSNITNRIGKTKEALELNKQNSPDSVKNFIKAAITGGLGKTIDDARLSPIYANYVTESDPKKATEQLNQKGFYANMPSNVFEERVKRLQQDEIKELNRLGYEIKKDTETGKLFVVDRKGEIIGEI